MSKSKSTPATPKPATPKPVALRGGFAVASVALKPGAKYATKAAHNQQWWASVTKACASGPAAVAALVTPAPAGPGVPAHFIGYCLRRGYLQEAK